MDNQLLIILNRKLDDLIAGGEKDAEVLRNALKEELQYYVLNFIYHHPVYSGWVMYGGSALRIYRDLDRMSVDLDFEINNPITDIFLNNLKIELENYFLSAYNFNSKFLLITPKNNRGFLLKFIIGDDLSVKHPSKQVHIKIDLNYFTALKIVYEKIPVSHNQLSFMINTYNMSALMASKIAAIILRGERGIGKEIYEEKGRDIYDLLWYMEQKIVPDLDYLKAKGIDISDLRTLFDKLTIKMSSVNNKNLENDLLPLFLDRGYIQDWIRNWLGRYFLLLNSYNIGNILALREVIIREDLTNDNFSFTFAYNTNEEKIFRIIYTISAYWIIFKDKEFDLSSDIRDEDYLDNYMDINNVCFAISTIGEKYKNKLLQYAAVFYKKNENYFKKTKNVVFGDKIITKVIRMDANEFNQKEQIVLNKSALISCELEDLLK